MEWPYEQLYVSDNFLFIVESLVDMHLIGVTLRFIYGEVESVCEDGKYKKDTCAWHESDLNLALLWKSGKGPWVIRPLVKGINAIDCGCCFLLMHK